MRQLEDIGRELSELDEGAMVRALATATARREGPEKREPILQGLDRLRALEDHRARAEALGFRIALPGFVYDLVSGQRVR